jgi:hypothetical protein
MIDPEPPCRPAGPLDAMAMAELINIAGDVRAVAGTRESRPRLHHPQ